MLLFLLRYYFDALFNWVLLTPLCLTFIMLIGLISGNFLPIHLLFTLVCFSVVSSNLFAFHKKHNKMFTLFPIPTKVFVATDYLFLSIIAVSYSTYSVFVIAVLKGFGKKQIVFPSLINWFVLLCATFILLSLYMILRFTKLQFLMGLYPLYFPFFISSSTPYIDQLTDFIPHLFSVAILSFGISLWITNYLSKRREMVW